ncbi:probable choline kinase 1 isoform X2 [Andrographis paniculata]|uniref:probable choline kinase 1 isoform X2 n=1 Tax=Andrographis paniculata TaxID=175694 RepID=UPI0021E9ACC6|nr:probable choline kinase 1 isoform X2 [Andrographis paniculata]
MAVKTGGFAGNAFPEELQQLLLSLASNWGDVIDLSALDVDHLSGAMTNEVYRISWSKEAENDQRIVLVRMYGDGVDLFFNRDEEIRTFDCLSELGYGPKLLGQFPQGRVEEFIHARTLSAGDLRNPEISALIAAKMREFHNLNVDSSKNVVLWNRLRNWLGVAKRLCSSDEAKEYKLESLENEISLLENTVSGNHQEIGFCHNDLQYGNIMIDDKNSSITIIDYEYSSYNPVVYDIANHFCEMAANYHTDTPHVLDYSNYPGEEERHRFIRHYLNSAGEEPSDAAVEKLAEDVEKYTLANHIFWGLWGIISAHVNHIDFDYKSYARQRLEQYWLRKSELLPLSNSKLKSVS